MQLRFSGIYKSYNGKSVLENISGTIHPGDKIGLVGRNGIGKTTLARILAGQEPCDVGTIEFLPPHGKIFYLEQAPRFANSESVYEAIIRAARSNLLINDAETTVKKLLNMLGIGEEKWAQRANSLSSGEKTKLALCRVAVSDFALLILDEPTNHLDLENCAWLEDYVGSLDKPLLVISHDRFFLDNVVSKIWELTPRELRVYEGNYSDYKRQKEIEQKSSEREYQKQQMKIRRLKQMISERKSWYNSAHNAAGQNDFYRSKAKKHAGVIRAKKRELERLESRKIDKPRKTKDPLFALLNKNLPEKKSAPFLVRGEGLGKSYAQKVLFQGASFNIKRGDKVVLLGPNGAGKTTLLKIIAGLDSDYSGQVTVNPAVKIGYFAQELENLDYGATVLDDVLTAGGDVEEARLLLASLLFRGDEVFKKISDLSMGEKGRVAFAKIILGRANFLILDEPTNYMDIASREKIEEVLAAFKGSIIFVTHDRYFMRLANRVFVIADGKLNCYEGNYEYYLAKEGGSKERNKVNGMSVHDYQELRDNINRLECELAFLSGQLSEARDEKEKEDLQERFFQIAKELNHFRKLI
ncbi:MAG: ABC-F type ribosomal protection protein [Firmicutes bacterium]|nr:ABC-F type ribosomal protection protein [Bacillota bacterium]